MRWMCHIPCTPLDLHTYRRILCSPPKLNQNRLHRLISCPVGKTGQFGGVDNTIPWVDAGKVHFTYKLDRWWLIWILVTAVHLYRVNSVLMDTLEHMVSVLLQSHGLERT